MVAQRASPHLEEEETSSALPAEPINPPLLQTRLGVPPLHSRRVRRPRLLKALDSDARLVVLSAPAGFGKTTLVADWLQQKGKQTPAAWLTLDESVNDPVLFWRYLVAALQVVQPGIGTGPLSLLEKARVPSLDVPLTLLVNDLATSDQTVTLVLDDYHLIQESAIHDSLYHFLEHQPANLHLLLLTRADPPLPLARWRVEQRLLEIRAGQLLFTGAETEAFLNEVMELGLNSQQIMALEKRTEGWAAGLLLAALSMKGISAGEVDQFVAQFSGTHHHVLDYLLQEVLERQPPAVQTFLLVTSILHHLNPSLCAALLEEEGPEPIRSSAPGLLSYLISHNLLVTPLDHQGIWYRYHPLFADLLRTRLQDTYPAQVTELHRRAAAWYAAHNRMNQSIRHALAGGDVASAASEVERAAEAAWAGGRLDRLRHWLAALPETVVCSRPRLCLIHAWVLFLHDEWPAAERRLAQAQQLVERINAADPEQEHLHGMLAAIGGAMAAHRQDSEHTVPLMKEALERLDPGDTAWHAVSAVGLGLAALAVGEVETAIPTFRETAAACERHGNLYLAFASLWWLADALRAGGQLRAAETAYHRLQWLGEESARSPLALGANATIGLGTLAYERNLLDKAVSQLQAGLGALGEEGQPRVLLAGHVYLARAYQAQGDLADADRELAAAAGLAGRRHLEAEAALLEAMAARLAVERGDLSAARRWAVAAGVNADSAVDYRAEFALLTLARLLLAQGGAAEAASLLERLLAHAENQGRQNSVIAILTLQALALYARREQSLALATLNRALTLAAPEGYRRIFLDTGPALTPLLHTIHNSSSERGPLAGMIADLLTAFRHSGRRPATTVLLAVPTSSGLLEPLTERELQVLQLLAAGASNQQIANQLVITIGTVKGHVNHILSKLDARNRVEAAVRARELSLL